MADDDIAILLERVAQQDKVAFRRLYEVTGLKLSAVLFRMLGNRSDAEDAMQEVYVRVWQRAAQFQQGRGSAQGWLIAVARNHALDRLRARPGRTAGMRRVEPRAGQSDEDASDPLDLVADGGPSALAGLVARDDARQLLACLDTLDPDRATAVRGAYLQGLSYQDLADKLNLPLNTVRTWLRRGLQSLRECMDR